MQWAIHAKPNISISLLKKIIATSTQYHIIIIIKKKFSVLLKLWNKKNFSQTIFNCGIKNYYNDFDNNFSLAVFSTRNNMYMQK